MIPRGNEGMVSIPVYLTREDVTMLDRAAREDQTTLGFYLDRLVADRVNELRRFEGLPLVQPPLRRGDLAPRAGQVSREPAGLSSTGHSEDEQEGVAAD